MKREFHVIIFELPGGNYEGIVAELGDCRVQGKTLDALISNGRRAIKRRLLSAEPVSRREFVGLYCVSV